MLARAEHGELSSIAFAVPSGATWPLPLYELALLTRAHLRDYGRDDVDIHLVTPEERPLEVFGHDASSDVESRLEQDDIELHTLTRARKHADGVLAFEGGGHVQAGCAVALPRLVGPATPGLPHDDLGFIPTDDHARVRGVPNVYAAGDCTCFPLKQGGIAAQQADAAAQAIAEAIGAGVKAAAFSPVLRGLLLTGDEPSYFRAYPGAERKPTSVAIDAPRRSRSGAPANVAGHRPLWWPPTKVAGPYLGAWLARPHEPGGEPLQIEDRELGPAGDEAAAAQERESALDLALAMADGEARYGDWKAALRALDAAEALAGALPPEYAQRRDLWEAELSGTPTARFRGD
jgi:sulfide:quinone oxidoreductase